MKISKKDLIQLLSEHLGSDVASISSQFDKLIADIQKATNKGDKFSINGFGEFVIEDGFLSFIVAPIFASEINYNYEGLMPVDIDKPDILLPTDSMDEAVDRPGVKASNIVIVDDAVEGEEDPFEGLEDELSDDTVDELVAEDDIMDGTDPVTEVDDDEPFDLEQFEEISAQQPKVVSADVDPDELAALDKLKSQNQEKVSLNDEDLSTSDSVGEIDEDPFADLGDEDSILLDKKANTVELSDEVDAERNEVDDLNDNSDDVIESKTDDHENTQIKETKSLEELLGEALKDSESGGGPTIIPVETTKASPSVLDEFFDDENKSYQKVADMAENENRVTDVSADSDEIFELDETQLGEPSFLDQDDDETELYEESSGGPRIVSVKESESEDKLSIGKLLPIAAVVLVIALIGGGAWWFLMGPGKSAFSSQPQTVVVQPEPQSTSSSTDNLQEGVESFQSGETIPLGSAEDDPEPPVSGDDEIAESSQELASENETSTSAEGAQSAQAGIGNASTSVPLSNAVEEPIAQSPTSSTANVPAANTQATTTANQNTQSEQAESAGSSVNTTFGLNGSVADLQGTVFSIIVHSLPSRQAAQRECDKISQQNLRCLVREASGPQGRRTYRVGIGQFATVDDAQSELTKLPEPFRSRNFIARIN